MNNGTQRKKKGCLPLFIVGFFAVFLVVFCALGYFFVSSVVNENTNAHEIEIVVEDKQIVSSTRDSLPDFVITATVLEEDGSEHSELFAIRASGSEVTNIYAALRVGERYTVSVNGDPDKYRVITGIVP